MNKMEWYIRGVVQHYNPKKYWKLRQRVVFGANCIVVEDVPDNATVVLEKPRIITRDKD